MSCVLFSISDIIAGEKNSCIPYLHVRCKCDSNFSKCLFKTYFIVEIIQSVGVNIKKLKMTFALNCTLFTAVTCLFYMYFSKRIFMQNFLTEYTYKKMKLCRQVSRVTPSLTDTTNFLPSLQKILKQGKQNAKIMNTNRHKDSL